MSKSYRLIGSHISAEYLAELVKTRWSWSDVLFVTVDEGKTYFVYTDGRPVNGLRVTVKRGRWRLEMEES